MKWLPQTKCPRCRGPITFFDVMGIITPFQCISCVSCGEMIFLKHPWGLLLLSLVFGLAVTLAAIGVVMNGLASNIVIYMTALLVLVVAEFVITGYVVKMAHLVVRHPK